MQKIVPHLWFDTQAREAAEFYTQTFVDAASSGKSVITGSQILEGTPSGDAEILTMQLYGQEFMLISAGPYFKFNPSISFLVGCETKEDVDALWQKLIQGGTPLMDIGAYPFSERYGWIQDAYGLSWQIMYMGGQSVVQRIVPTLMFVGDVSGKAEEAMIMYTSVFPQSKITYQLRYGADEVPEREGTIKHGGFALGEQQFAAMDSAQKHAFAFNEAVSLVVKCDSQKEIDYYWEKLSAVPEAEQCGWLKDAYGVSWQIVPRAMDTWMHTTDKAALNRLTQAFLKMKKFDIATLEQVVKSAK